MRTNAGGAGLRGETGSSGFDIFEMSTGHPTRILDI